MTVLIAGGGTGGHVFPMLAVGQAILRDHPSVQVFYVGTARGLEAKLVPAAGGDLEVLDVLPLRGRGALGAARGLWKATASLVAAAGLVRRRKPDVVLTVGGYAGGPVALAARAMGVPLAVLEPNSVLGLTNRLLSPISQRAYVAFGDVDKSFGTGVAVRSGVPLRGAFAPRPYAAAAGRFRVLVLGGSLGASGLNANVPGAAFELLRAVPFAQVVHQTGRGNESAVREAYRALGEKTAERVSVVEFIDDVARELDLADVVLQRCGASSLAELCVVGRASILVPYPFATDQHQLANARTLERAGAAIAVSQADATPGRLAELLIDLALAPEKRAQMADSARGLGRPEAARDVARDLVELAEKQLQKREAR